MNDRIFTARLVTTAPLHTGSGDGGLATSLTLSRDHAGRFYVPGTQVAGRLRETATRLAPALGWKACTALTGAPGVCGCPVCVAFGERGHDPEPPAGKAGGGRARAQRQEGSASRIWCFDAPEAASCPGRVVVRDGVGISRHTGTAAAEAGALYDAEWIPAGTAFELRVEVEHGADEQVEQVLALALSEWVEGRGRLGAGQARGGGAFTLKEHAFRTAALEGHGGLMAFLREPVPERRGRADEKWLPSRLEKLRALRSAAPQRTVPRDCGAVGHYARVTFDLRFEGAMLVSDPAAALVNTLHFVPVFAGPDWTSPVLPGSSLRGVLRAQVERIARTVGTRAVARSGNPARALAERCPACDPFARAPRPEAGGTTPALASCGSRHDAWEQAGRAGEEPPDCLGCALFGSTHRGSRLWIADAVTTGAPQFLLRDFVSIDRFTGGARDGAKFDALPLWRPAFHVSLLLWDAQPWELAALAFALRDVHDGLATMGAHGSKGFGRGTVEGEVTVELGAAAAGAPALRDAEPLEESGVFRRSCWRGDPEAFVALARAAGWAGEFVSRCAETRRTLAPGADLADTYFGVTTEDGIPLPELYPPLVHADDVEVAHG